MAWFLRSVEFDFNSHAHVERDNDGTPYLGVVQDFNSHAHVERDAISNGSEPL